MLPITVAATLRTGKNFVSTFYLGHRKSEKFIFQLRLWKTDHQDSLNWT